MKSIEIKERKKLHRTAKKILNCIVEAKKRIGYQEENLLNWEDYFWYTKEYCQNRIDTLKMCISRLEARYTKVVLKIMQL